jgi:hypothetical protein
MTSNNSGEIFGGPRLGQLEGTGRRRGKRGRGWEEATTMAGGAGQIVGSGRKRRRHSLNGGALSMPGHKSASYHQAGYAFPATSPSQYNRAVKAKESLPKNKIPLFIHTVQRKIMPDLVRRLKPHMGGALSMMGGQGGGAKWPKLIGGRSTSLVSTATQWIFKNLLSRIPPEIRKIMAGCFKTALRKHLAPDLHRLVDFINENLKGGHFQYGGSFIKFIKEKALPFLKKHSGTILNAIGTVVPAARPFISAGQAIYGAYKHGQNLTREGDQIRAGETLSQAANQYKRQNPRTAQI